MQEYALFAGFILLTFALACKLTREYEECDVNIIGLIQHAGRKYGRFVLRVGGVLFCCLFMVYACYMDRNASSVWGLGLLSRILGIISNSFGVAGFFEIPWFLSYWKILGYIAVLYFFVAFLHFINKKTGPFILLFCAVVTAVISYVLHIDKFLIGYIPAAVCGVLVAGFGKRQEGKNSVPGRFVQLIFSQAVSVFMFFTFIYRYWFADSGMINNRWLRLFVILLLAFAASMLFEGICHICKYKHIKKMWDSGYGIAIIAIATVIISYMIASVTCEMGYLTSDDGVIQNTLCGNTTGSPYPVHQFIHVFLGYPIAFLYKLCPYVQWWYIYSQMLIVVGMFLTHFCILKLSKKSGQEFKVPIITIAVLDFGFYLYMIGNVAFTIVPAVFGTGLVALLMLADGEKRKKRIVLTLCVVAVGYVVVYAHRGSVGTAYLCYILMAFLYMITGTDIKVIKKAVTFLAGCVALILLCFALGRINKAAQIAVNGEAYVEYNSARASYVDYPHDSYEENPEIYQKAGWSEETYLLVESFCLMLEEVDADSLTYLSENSQKQSLNETEIQEFFTTDARCRAGLMLWIASGAVLILILIFNFDIRSLIFAVFNNAGTFILILYQLFSGRILYRSTIIILLPAFVFNCILAINNYHVKGIKRRIVCIISAVLIMACSAVTFEYVYDKDWNNKKIDARATARAVSTYAIEHGDNVYVAGVALARNLSPWNIYPGRTPYNLVRWGGSMYYSDCFYVQLEENGIVAMNGSIFKDNNKFFISPTNVMAKKYRDKGTAIFPVFYRYLKQNYGAVGFIQTDTIEQYAYVYQFVFEDNAEEFDNYYDIVDGYVVEIVKTE